MDIPEFQGPEEQRERSKSLAPSELTRLSEPPPDPSLEEGDESHADVTCPIALFDDRTVASQSQSQTQSQGPSEGSDDGKGYSKTVGRGFAACFVLTSCLFQGQRSGGQAVVCSQRNKHGLWQSIGRALGGRVLGEYLEGIGKVSGGRWESIRRRGFGRAFHN